MKTLPALLFIALSGCQWSARIEADTVGCAGFVARKISIETQGIVRIPHNSKIVIDDLPMLD